VFACVCACCKNERVDKIFCDPVQFSLLFLFFFICKLFFKVKFFSEMDKREKNIMLPSLERSMSRVCKQYGCNREVVVVVVLVLEKLKV